MKLSLQSVLSIAFNKSSTLSDNGLSVLKINSIFVNQKLAMANNMVQKELDMVLEQEHFKQTSYLQKS